MADISEVKEEEIRDLFQSLEDLSCKLAPIRTPRYQIAALISDMTLTTCSAHPDEGAVLSFVLTY